MGQAIAIEHSPWTPTPLESYASRVPLIRRHVLIEAEGRISLPVFRGALWHSVIGMSLKSLVCHVPPGVCRGCPARLVCPYPALMEAESAPSAGGPFGRGARVPGPLILDTGAWGPTRLDPGGRSGIAFTIIGSDQTLAARVEEAVAHAVSGRLGRGRGTARIVEVTTLPDLAEVLSAGGRTAVTPVRLRLVTPLRLKRGGVLLRRFDLVALARDLSLRLAALGHYHGGLPWPAPWAEALSQAASASVTAAVRWVEGVRYSARQEREIVMGGLVGEVEIDGAGDDLRWLLAAGCVLHAGKGASMGLGQMEIVRAGEGEPTCPKK